MRALVAACLGMGLALAASPAGAQDIETVRTQLEQLRQQFEGIKQQYERQIKELGDRIQQLEGQRAVPAAAAPRAPGRARAPASRGGRRRDSRRDPMR